MSKKKIDLTIELTSEKTVQAGCTVFKFDVTLLNLAELMPSLTIKFMLTCKVN